MSLYCIVFDMIVMFFYELSSSDPCQSIVNQSLKFEASLDFTNIIIVTLT